ncbi:phage integrase family protein [Pseudodesulfovibrio indicus]|nr:phage integrase family protein [Pseudodesulfovibrio indicus]
MSLFFSGGAEGTRTLGLRKRQRKTCRYHGIRHLAAMELFHAGHPVSLIQRILRHKNPNTTARYLHELGLDNALEQIDGTF